MPAQPMTLPPADANTTLQLADAYTLPQSRAYNTSDPSLNMATPEAWHTAMTTELTEFFQPQTQQQLTGRTGYVTFYRLFLADAAHVGATDADPLPGTSEIDRTLDSELVGAAGSFRSEMQCLFGAAILYEYMRPMLTLGITMANQALQSAITSGLTDEQKAAWETLKASQIALLQKYRDAHDFLFGIDNEGGFIAQLEDIGAGSYYSAHAAELALVAAATQSDPALISWAGIYELLPNGPSQSSVRDTDQTRYDIQFFNARSHLYSMREYAEAKLEEVKQKIASREWSVSRDGKLDRHDGTDPVALKEYFATTIWGEELAITDQMAEINPVIGNVHLNAGSAIPEEHSILDETGITHYHVYIENEGQPNQREVRVKHDERGYTYAGGGRLARIEGAEFQTSKYDTYQRNITDSEDYPHEVAYWAWLMNSGSYVDWLVSQVPCGSERIPPTCDCNPRTAPPECTPGCNEPPPVRGCTPAGGCDCESYAQTVRCERGS